MEKGGKQLNAAVFWVAPGGECSLTRRRQAAAANDVATAGRLGRVGRGKLRLRQESKCSCVLVGHNEHDAGARRIVGHRKAIAHIKQGRRETRTGASLPAFLPRPARPLLRSFLCHCQQTDGHPLYHASDFLRFVRKPQCLALKGALRLLRCCVGRKKERGRCLQPSSLRLHLLCAQGEA